jgi:cysteine desulfurase
MARHYLDHASTSPLRPEGVGAMVGVLEGRGFEGLLPADPGRIHSEGMAARVGLEQARAQVAALVGARPREVVFTSGATESIAAATWGALWRATQPRAATPNPSPRPTATSDPTRPLPQVVLAAVEHSAVHQSSESFAQALGARVTTVGVDRSGCVDPDAVLEAVDATGAADDGPDLGGTALVHLQWGNHEVGTLQPVAEVVAGCRERGVLIHLDAAMAVGHVEVAFDDLGADLLSFSGHKLGGPPGTGVLLVRRGLRLAPLLLGGDQERARRAGLENLPALLGLGAVARALDTDGLLAIEQARARAQTDRVLAAVASIEGVHPYGDPIHRLPHLICLGIDDIEPQAVLLGLDQAGIAAHSGSACATEGLEDSPVLAAMGVDAHRSLRISVGWSTTDADIEALLGALPVVIGRLRALGPAS